MAGELRAALAQVLLEGLRDPRVTPVTLTSVEVSPDLRLATVRFVSLGGQGDPVRIQEGLDAAQGWIRRQVGKKVHLKYLPKFRFYPDPGVDHAAHMTQLLDGLAVQREEEE